PTPGVGGTVDVQRVGDLAVEDRLLLLGLDSAGHHGGGGDRGEGGQCEERTFTAWPTVHAGSLSSRRGGDPPRPRSGITKAPGVPAATQSERGGELCRTCTTERCGVHSPVSRRSQRGNASSVGRHCCERNVRCAARLSPWTAVPIAPGPGAPPAVA